MKPRILVVGNAGMELLIGAARMPITGQTGECSELSCRASGKAFRVAAALARLGADAVLCARAGSDLHGQLLLDECKGYDLDTRFVHAARTGKTSVKVRLRTPEGERYLIHRGEALTPDDVAESFLSYPDAIILDLAAGDSQVRAVSRYAAKNGIPLFIDLSDDTPKPEVLPESAETVCLNREGVLALTGISVLNQDACLRACVELFVKYKVKYAVVRLSERGSFMYDGTRCEFMPSFTVLAKDGRHPGDAYLAALAYARIYGKIDMVEACTYANAAAALYVSSSDDKSPFPDRDAVRALLESRGVTL